MPDIVEYFDTKKEADEYAKQMLGWDGIRVKSHRMDIMDDDGTIVVREFWYIEVAGGRLVRANGYVE